MADCGLSLRARIKMESKNKKRTASRTVDADKALQRLAALCARSEQCSSDMAAKLSGYGLAEEEQAEVLRKLVDNGFVDDTRYAGSVARDKVRFAGWGRIKIRAYLAAKGISREIIDSSLATIDPADYKEALLRVARAKARNLNLRDNADRAKFVRHLAARGFEAGLAFRLLAAADKRLDS